MDIPVASHKVTALITASNESELFIIVLPVEPVRVIC